MNQANGPLVLIAGAGIGGLVTALALLKRGIDCEVYEQASELREIGAGLWISTNGARVLFDLGLQDAIRSAALETDERLVRLWNTGESRWLYKRGETPSSHQPYVLLRAHLLNLLVEAVRRIKPTAIHLNARCVGFSQEGGRVRLQYEGGSAHGDVLIGADGVHSRIRDTALGPVGARYTHAVAWRGLVPMERLSPHQSRSAVATWVGPTAHCTVYPVRWRDSLLMTFSGQVERNAWQAESWSEKGAIEECLADFEGWHPDIIEMVRHADTLHKWGLFVREPLVRWSTGRVSLLGDACHSMVPYLGQGVNMAIEDACVLARCLQAYGTDPVSALQRYEQARMERTYRVAEASAAMQATFHHPALAHESTAMPYVDSQWNPEMSRKRYGWIYEYDATSVAI